MNSAASYSSEWAAGYSQWKIIDAGTVTLGRTVYRVEVQEFANGESETHLYGPRGAMYLLRRFIERKGDTGLRQVISATSGAPLRVRGNEVRVYQLGTVIEVAA
jgi:hypothetical protein